MNFLSIQENQHTTIKTCFSKSLSVIAFTYAPAHPSFNPSSSNQPHRTPRE